LWPCSCLGRSGRCRTYLTGLRQTQARNPLASSVPRPTVSGCNCTRRPTETRRRPSGPTPASGGRVWRERHREKYLGPTRRSPSSKRTCIIGFAWEHFPHEPRRAGPSRFSAGSTPTRLSWKVRVLQEAPPDDVDRPSTEEAPPSTQASGSEGPFRVQVYATTEREDAQSLRAEARQWWQEAQEQAPSGVFEDGPLLTIEQEGAYYRVRMGHSRPVTGRAGRGILCPESTRMPSSHKRTRSRSRETRRHAANDPQSPCQRRERRRPLGVEK